MQTEAAIQEEHPEVIDEQISDVEHGAVPSHSSSAEVPARWIDLIPLEQWEVYRRAIAAVRSLDIPFLLGGGFSLATYIGRWRNTKDIDFYILPQHRDTTVEALNKAGFRDYYPEAPYDRGWIYRSTGSGVIVDIIWSMANRRAQVDESWFHQAPSCRVREEEFQVLPAEVLCWCKLYVFQRDHCDWTDVINLLTAVGPTLDWKRLLNHLGPDLALLKSMVTLLDWLAPNRTGDLPKAVRKKLGLPCPEPISDEEHLRRVRLLDTRAWFAALLPEDLRLQV